MDKIITPSSVKGRILAPASKSFAQRAIACALLSNGESCLKYYTPCDDSEAALTLVQNLGATIRWKNQDLYIEGKFPFQPKTDTLNCHEAGLGIRMFSPIAALHNQTIELTGSGSLASRPMHLLAEPLTTLGSQFHSQDGCLPLKITGPLQGGEATLDGSLSSQVLTGFLIALSQAKNPSTLHVKNLKSNGYIDMTLDVIRDFGGSIHHTNYKTFHITPQAFSPIQYNIEGDWSGAAFLMVAAAISGEIIIDNLSQDSTQADKAILEALKKANVLLAWQGNSLSISPPPNKVLKPFIFDATNCPDLFPPLVSLASHCQGVSRISGVHRLKHKESDRGSVLKQEFNSLGIQIDIEGDEFVIHGGTVKATSSLNSHNDHRIPMALAVASLKAESPVTINNVECIAKSYPHFFEDLATLGAKTQSV